MGREASASSAASACWSARTPSFAARCTTRRRWPAPRRRSRSTAARWQDRKESCTRSRWRRRTAPAAGCASRSARSRTSRESAPQGDQHAAAGSVARAGAGELGLLPEAARCGSAGGAPRQRQGRAVAGAAVRVLRRLRRLRRDAVPKLLTQLFGDRAADRQRHRLLVDLRRQPADDAVDDEPRRPRPGLVELAVRGQCGVRTGHAAGPGQAGRVCRRAGARGWRSGSATSWRASLPRPTRPRRPGIDEQRERVRLLRRSWQGVDSPAGARPDGPGRHCW